MSDWQRTTAPPAASRESKAPQDFWEACHELSNIKHVIAVMKAARGGVGKSLVTASLAVASAGGAIPSAPRRRHHRPLHRSAFGIHERMPAASWASIR